MSKERLEEILEEHRPNLDVIEHISTESFKYLYQSLVNELINESEGE